MEEILKEILRRLDGIQTQTNERLDGIDNRLDGIDGELKEIRANQTQTNGRLDLIESQQSENTQLIKALLHASEVHKADIDNLTHAVARVEGEVKELRNDLSAIEAITAKNWKDIVYLKTAK